MTVLPDAGHGIIERNGKRGTITFRRRLGHPVDRVWNAIATPDGLAGWWLPFPAEITVDLRVGGEMRFAPSDPDIPTMTCEVLEVEPPHRLVHTSLDGVSTVRWDLEPDGDGCMLTLTQITDDIDATIAQRHVVGLHTSLDRLGPALDGALIEWDWGHFGELQRSYEAGAPANQSAAASLVREYMDAFAAGDHTRVLACLTDDVVWDIVGEGVFAGQAEFAAQIHGDEATGPPTLGVEALYESGDVVVAVGRGHVPHRDTGTFEFRFADTFTVRDGAIARLASFVVPVGSASTPNPQENGQ
jgi:uncharacterized protein YndB with AHSA1/START domain/ketosteroid isomerase-like protein